MNTQTHRIVSVLMIALMVAVVAAGWFLVAQPQLAAAAASNDQLTSVESQISSSQASLVTLRKGEADLPKLTSRLAALQQSIPSTMASSALVSGIDQQAVAAGVQVISISVDDPAAYAPPAPPATAAPGSSPAGATPSPTPSASASATPSPAASPTKTQYTPKSDALVTAANFVTVPVSVTVQGTWSQTLAFVKNLQSGTRLFAVGTLSTKQKSDDAAQYTTAVSGYVFAMLDPTSQAAKAAKAAGAKTSATSSPTPTPRASVSQKPAPTASATPFPSESPTPAVTPSR